MQWKVSRAADHTTVSCSRRHAGISTAVNEVHALCVGLV